MAQEFEFLRRQVSAVERQMGFLNEVASALVKQDGKREADLRELHGTQAGQQRAIEELDRRVRRLEENDGSAPKP